MYIYTYIFFFIKINDMRGKIFKSIQYWFFEKNKSSPLNPLMSWPGYSMSLPDQRMIKNKMNIFGLF